MAQSIPLTSRHVRPPRAVLEWISDTWAYERDEAVEESGDELTDEIEADFHRFEWPVGTRWPQVTSRVTNLAAEIATAFQRIEKANPRSLVGVFGNASRGNQERIPESALLDLVNAFNEIRLDPSTVSHDLLGAGYEYP